MKTTLLFLLLGTSGAWADEPISEVEEPAVPALVREQGPGNRKDTATLDFEGEVIEGERKAADLFIQYDVGNVALEAVLYQRGDFNEFHAQDRARRAKLPALAQRRKLK